MSARFAPAETETRSLHSAVNGGQRGGGRKNGAKKPAGSARKEDTARGRIEEGTMEEQTGHTKAHWEEQTEAGNRSSGQGDEIRVSRGAEKYLKHNTRKRRDNEREGERTIGTINENQ